MARARMSQKFSSRARKTIITRCHRLAGSLATIAALSTLCYLASHPNLVCHGSTLAPYELIKTKPQEEPLAPSASQVRIVTNTKPIVSSGEGLPHVDNEDEPEGNGRLLDRFTRFRESLQRERLRDLQANFRERLDSIRSHVGAAPDKIYKLNIDLPIRAATSASAELDPRQADASSLDAAQQVANSAGDINRLVKYDDNLQDGEATSLSRQNLFAPPTADYSQAQFDRLASSLASSLFGYYPAPEHHRVARSVTLDDAQQQQQRRPLNEGTYQPIASSPMVAHEPPTLMMPSMINGHQVVPAQASASMMEHQPPVNLQQQQDNLGSDSIWANAGDPFEAPHSAGFGQRSTGGGESSEEKLLGQEHAAHMEAPMVQRGVEEEEGAPPAPPGGSNYDQIKLASSEEYSGDKYAMKSDEEGEGELEYKPAARKLKVKAYKAPEEDEEEAYEAPPPPPPPPKPVKKVIIKKEMKHHHYHHHHHHHPEPKKQVEKKPAKPVQVQAQPLHLEIHIKGKSKSKSKSKSKGKGKDKDKSKGKEGDEIYVKLNQGSGSQSASGQSDSYGGGSGGGYSAGDEGSYADGGKSSQGNQLIEDKKSLVEEDSPAESGSGGGGGGSDEGEQKHQQQVPVKQEEQEEKQESDSASSEGSESEGSGGGEQEQAGGEGKSSNEMERTEQAASGGSDGGGSGGGGGHDVINPSQVPDFGHFETFFDEGPINKHEHQKHGAGGGGSDGGAGGSGGEGGGGGGGGGGSGGGEEGSHEKHKKEEKKQVKEEKKQEHVKEQVKEQKKEQKKVHKKHKEEEKKQEVVEQEVVKHHEEKKVEPEVVQQEVKKEEPVVEAPKKQEQEHKHEKVHNHKAKHAHIEVHQHKHFEHHQHINLQHQQQPEVVEHNEKPQQEEHEGGGGGSGEHELSGHELGEHLGGGHEGHGGEVEHMPIEPHHMHHQPEHEMPIMDDQHHQHHHHGHHQPIIESEHHHPIKEHWSAPDIHEKPPSKEHPHGAFVIEDHSELEKHGYDNHGGGLHYKEEVINHPHGFGLTPVAAYNLMGAYSTQKASHSSGSSEAAAGALTNKKNQQVVASGTSLKNKSTSGVQVAQEKPTRH